MPKRKQPKTLADLALLRVVKMIRCACESWITALRQAASAGIMAYVTERENVTADCDTVHELLTSLLTGISVHQATLILKETIAVITNSYDSCNDLNLAPWNQNEMHNSVCVKILRTVLLSNTTEYEMKHIYSSFTQRLIIQTLDCVPELTILAFDSKTETDNSALMSTNIHHLKNLQHFQYEYHCTDDVVEELGLHCTELKTINLKYSRAVTDTSVQHLMKLKKLEYVHLLYTNISYQLYGSLLSELPNISNIAMMSETCDVLDHISKEKLNTIKQYVGLIHNIDNMTQKCPNLTTVKVYAFNQNLTKFIALTRLVNLQIMVGNSENCNLTEVLVGMGTRLSSLSLFYIRNVNISNIVMMCSALKSLVLEACTFVLLNENSEIDTELPHYRNLTEFKLVGDSFYQSDVRKLRHYVNLQVFECKRLDILTDDFIRDATRQGAFRNILRFWVEETGRGALTMSTVELLLQHCEHLREIGLLRNWRRVTPCQRSSLIERMRTTNVDLHIH
ncbi:hypothetical protein B7P43_G14262 [Cryptotermes secundus]|uniref:F-box domain-containing protein n=2 Tax=Cryptotermes secundus TaxID=105785 RepID=A0A2J7PH65_9NEOP|nr:uncharacterized protein LOC111874021 isoform X2 [Cryptotermes secundus]PNF15669.1 hypothetical protein B7P43_G14262 [Cryptotermes secundus]